MGDLVLVRHGETAWSREQRHTGRTDVPLTERGRRQGERLRAVLAGRSWAAVRTSPLSRAAQTAQLALGYDPPSDPRLMEWDYGQVEGRTTEDWRASHPGWVLWRDGCPEGESADQVGARADAVLAGVAAELEAGDVLLVAHGHLLRVLTARRLGLGASAGRLFVLDPATVSVLGAEHGEPAMRSWNLPPVTVG